MDATEKKEKLVSSPQASSSAKHIRITANFRTGYLFKKTRDGKWQKRWFETNGCFLTYYKVKCALQNCMWRVREAPSPRIDGVTRSFSQKQGQKLLAALNLPQVGAIALLGEDSSDGPGLFTIELNERVYTIKARSHEEAAFWVDVRQVVFVCCIANESEPIPSRQSALTHTFLFFLSQALLWRQAGGVVTQKSPAEVNKVNTIAAEEPMTTESTRKSSSAASKSAPINPDDQELPPEEQLKGGPCGPCCIIQ